MLDINAIGAISSALSAGVWRIAPTRECWYRQGNAEVAAEKAGIGSAYLDGGVVQLLRVTSAGVDDHVHVIAGDDATDGKASLTKEE